MGEQNTITITVDEYSVFLREMTRLDILREELVAIYDRYVDSVDKDRLLRIAGIDVGVDVKTAKETEVISHD